MQLRESEFVSVPKAAVLLGVTPHIVRKNIKLHALPAMRLPTGAVRIRRAELQTWLDAQQQTQAVRA